MGLTRVMSSLLYGVGSLDPMTYASVAALLRGAGARGHLFARATCHARRPDGRVEV